MGWGGWGPYVPAAQRRAQALREVARMTRKGLQPQPERPEGREIARSFWGRAWCDHLEKFSDFENRLPRGRTYLRNGSVVHLEVAPGRIVAKVSGSTLYDVEITIRPLATSRWRRLRADCLGNIGSSMELLQGRLSEGVMTVVTARDTGLFPSPREMSLDCSCPDWATMCKHVAAALYGVGSRLDRDPGLLFRLRSIDPAELIGRASIREVISSRRIREERRLPNVGLAEVFGIDLAREPGAKGPALALPPPTGPAEGGGRSTAPDSAMSVPRAHSRRATRPKRGRATEDVAAIPGTSSSPHAAVSGAIRGDGLQRLAVGDAITIGVDDSHVETVRNIGGRIVIERLPRREREGGHRHSAPERPGRGSPDRRA
jgi:uncharacterized Zn finger protein